MNKTKLLIVFLILSVFLIKPAYAQDDWFSAWTKTFSGQLGPTPDYLVNFLKNFGLPEEILVDWGGIIFYIIIPILTFALVLKAIMVDEIIVRMMGLRVFSDWKGWIFVLLIVLFLFPTGLVGMFAMWLYAAAGILVIYGFGALLIVGVITKLAPGIKGKWLGGLILSIFALIFLSFFNPAFAIIIGILGIFMSLASWRKTQSLKIGEPYKEARKMGDDLMWTLSSIIERYKGKLPSNVKLQLEFEAKDIIRRAYTGSISPAEREKIEKEFEKKVRAAAGLPI